tara:strand:+ start:303 stop:653 length:351 start_codon:yes stop_codon:yes gene_type:complete
MANYAKVVSWASKDALSDTDVKKIISGADFHTEFSAIETAIQTKAEINGDASESFSALTPTNPSDNTTKVATTEWVEDRIALGTAVATNSNGYGIRTISQSAASGGNNGDIHYQTA